MKYQNVCLEAVAYTLPDEVVTSAELEARLEPFYGRLRLSAGRLELMTGIRQRRFWPDGTRVSDVSGQTAAKVLELAGLDARHVGALVHGSVCRDYLEPATACRVHHLLELVPECIVYDVSNACLGILNGIVQVAALVELGQIRAGIVVGTENARPLVENTIRTLNAETLTRSQMKLAMASLTIGSASAAVLLVDKELSRTGNRLLAATARAHSAAHELCRGEEASSGELTTAPLMQTDSEALLHAGIAAGAAAFDEFLLEAGWSRDEVHKTCCHQVGSAHRKLLLERLALDASIDLPTYETLGNTGSAAVPVTLAMAAESGHLQPRDHAALLGIGSGINVLLLAVDWQKSLAGESSSAPPSRKHARASRHR
jgi:3-oxoacyl-[acyl-carrier-protein] synthase-3